MKAQKTDRTERMGIGIAMTAFEALDFAFREQSESDYGIDAHAELIKSEQPTGRIFGIQLKSGESYLTRKCETGFVFPIDKDHVEYWLNHALPVLICLCDVEARNVYWQVVTNETAISTGKGYKFIVPSTQLINSSSREPLRKWLTPTIPATRYTICEQSDISHAAARRYSFKIVINGGATKAEIAAMVRQITNDGIKSKYSRNSIVDSLSDLDAQVVYTFIYPTAEDYSRGIWICRSIWIDKNLDEEFRPVGFKGENVGDSIIVDWNDGYLEFAACLSERTASKEQYLSTVLPMIDELRILFKKLEDSLGRYKNNEINEEDFIVLTEDALKRVDELYLEGTHFPFSAPFECHYLNDKFQNIICSFDNICLYYAEDSKWTKENRLYLSLNQCESVRKNLQGFEYELEKIR